MRNFNSQRDTDKNMRNSIYNIIFYWLYIHLRYFYYFRNRIE